MSAELHISDLVQYRNRTSLERSDLVGFVIGSSPQGRAYVLWLHPGGQMSMELHQDAALRVLERLKTTVKA
jgi:hypothetical protein